MQKDLIFFGEGGITDTQANRVADYAKLAYAELESEFNSISFIDKKIETINSEKSKNVSYGAPDLRDIMGKVKRMGDLKSLIAWLREAIKSHQNLINEAKSISFEKYCADNNIDYPVAPSKDVVPTEDDVLASFDVKKRNRYFELESHATAIGQVIHKDCAIDRARKDYYNRLNNPCDVIEKGNDTIIWTYSPSVSKEEIENTFYELQQEHAKYQSELNSIKSEIKSRITNSEIDANKKYEEECAKYSEVVLNLKTGFATWKSEEQKRINNLKIIIPNSLKDIYGEISSLGKKKK